MHSSSNPQLSTHLASEHKVSPAGQYISEIVYGGVDGIITTFAVVAGFAGAGATSALGQIGPLAVVLFGLANLFGDGVSMALGKYLSTKSEQDIYHHARDQEHYEIIHNTQMEKEECESILIDQGMTPSDATATVQLMMSYPDIWIKWMMDNELGLADARAEKPVIQGFITLISFVFFGAIPLIPYLFLDASYDYWMISLRMTGAALVLLGVVRRSITRISLLWTVSQIVCLGAIAAAVAYWTGQIVIQMG